MLIRNVKSFADLEKKKTLQAQILQVAIDNESMLETRVKDYRNPNKPPPVPPQYKTNSELALDTNFQQKEVIDNLLSIKGVDNVLALSVSQNLAQLANGVGNYLIFNKNFPIIRKRLEDLSKRSYGVDTFMEKIEEVLEQINLGIFYQSTGGQNANAGFNMAMGAGFVLPSGQTIASLQAELQADPTGATVSSAYGLLLAELYAIQNVPQSPLALDPTFIAMVGIVESLTVASPETDYLQDFDLIEFAERQKLQRAISVLSSTYNLPKSIDIEYLSQTLSPNEYANAVQAGAGGQIQLPQTFEKAYAKLVNKINGIKTPVAKSIGELVKVKDKIVALLGGQVAVRAGLQGQIAQAQAGQAQAQAQLVLQQQQQQQQLAQDLVDKQITRDRIVAFQTPPLDKQAMQERLIALNLALAGLPIVYMPDGQPKTVFDNWSGKAGMGWVNRGGQNYTHPTDDELASAGFNGGYQNIDVFLSMYLLKRDIGKNNGVGKTQERYRDVQLMAKLQGNIASISTKLNNDPAFIPQRNDNQRVVIQQGFGVKRGKGYTIHDFGNDIKGFFGGGVPKDNDHMKGGKGLSFKEFMMGSQGQGLICPQNYAPVRAKDGKVYNNKCMAIAGGGEDPNFKGSPYAIDGMGFMNRKIKIGAGIAVQQQPRYKTFGKYIIHMPFLENDNVLNVKFQSMGTIPSIKPVSIDDNFKDFVLDIMNTGHVNQQHYNTLTEAEKSHFHKIVKGAGLSNTLKFKQDSKIDDKKDIKRIDILVGEIVAGNDNDKVMKEAKELIRKCVENGSITKYRGMDLLLQIQ